MEEYGKYGGVIKQKAFTFLQFSNGILDRKRQMPW